MDESDINKIQIKFHWLTIFYHKLHFEMSIPCKNYWLAVQTDYAILLQVYFKIVGERMYTINPVYGIREPWDINRDASIPYSKYKHQF